jgi:hypothetical protein
MTQGTGIILLHKEKFDFYSPLFGKIVEFKFVPEIIRDFDVANSELLENLIKLFVESNKIPKSELIIVISDNASFIKDIFPTNPAGQKQDIKEETDKFIDSVPFDEVASMTFPMPQGTKVWATNKGLFEVLANAFDKNGFKVTAVLPGILFGNVVGSGNVLDPVTVNTINQKLESIKAEHNFLTQKPVVPVIKKEEMTTTTVQNINNVVEVEGEANKKPDKKRLVAMIGIFVFLLIVLVFVYIGSLNQ